MQALIGWMSANLVTLECDPTSFEILLTNRNKNNFNFNTENCALSHRPLILSGWNSTPFDGLNIPTGHIKVNTITFNFLEKKYNIKFDTLVVDCEGALYYILLDDPTMLNNIITIIMENDYFDISHKNRVDDIIKENGFKRIYSVCGGWGPCENNFYEVWRKN